MQIREAFSATILSSPGATQSVDKFPQEMRWGARGAPVEISINGLAVGRIPPTVGHRAGASTRSCSLTPHRFSRRYRALAMLPSVVSPQLIRHPSTFPGNSLDARFLRPPSRINSASIAMWGFLSDLWPCSSSQTSPFIKHP